MEIEMFVHSLDRGMFRSDPNTLVYNIKLDSEGTGSFDLMTTSIEVAKSFRIGDRVLVTVEIQKEH